MQHWKLDYNQVEQCAPSTLVRISILAKWVAKVQVAIAQMVLVDPKRVYGPCRIDFPLLLFVYLQSKTPVFGLTFIIPVDFIR